jgi:ATP-dependent RNA helicase SUPV3L1/SUV3
MAAASDALQTTEAAEAVEGAAMPPPAETAHIETATADLGAPAPTTDAAASTAAAPPTEPQFDEVWFPAGRRSDNPRHTRKPRDGAAGDGAAEGTRPPRRFNRNANGGPKPDGAAANEGGAAAAPRTPRPDRPKHFGADKKPFNAKGNGKPKFGGKRDRAGEDWKEHRPREKRDLPLDPDSPWAKLAALRNPKPDSP